MGADVDWNMGWGIIHHQGSYSFFLLSFHLHCAVLDLITSPPHLCIFIPKSIIFSHHPFFLTSSILTFAPLVRFRLFHLVLDSLARPEYLLLQDHNRCHHIYRHHGCTCFSLILPDCLTTRTFNAIPKRKDADGHKPIIHGSCRPCSCLSGHVL